jgi:hypothetical protein
MRSYRNSRYLGGKPSLLLIILASLLLMGLASLVLTGVGAILEPFGAFLSWFGCQFRRVLAAQSAARIAREQAREESVKQMHAALVKRWNEEPLDPPKPTIWDKRIADLESRQKQRAKV